MRCVTTGLAGARAADGAGGRAGGRMLAYKSQECCRNRVAGHMYRRQQGMGPLGPLGGYAMTACCCWVGCPGGAGAPLAPAPPPAAAALLLPHCCCSDGLPLSFSSSPCWLLGL